MHVGTNLRNARRRSGLTQADLAQIAGISQNYVAQIEGGTRAPSIRVMQSLAKAIGIQVSDLVAEADVSEQLRQLVDLVGLRKLREDLEKLASERKINC